MGDAGEGLVDAESRIQERLDALEQARADAKRAPVLDPEAVREVESLRLARTELQRQRDAASNAARRDQLGHAIAELDRRMTALRARLTNSA